MKSRLHLPKLDPQPETILDYLIAHFPQIAANTWRERIARGLISVDDIEGNGTILTAESPYRHGITVLYLKEVPDEPAADEAETILHRDENILVADKPHGMIVTPAGDHVERSLLVRLQSATGLAPHRRSGNRHC